MCAILDANVASQVFGDNRPEAGVKFFEWIDHGHGRLVVGRVLRNELIHTRARNWLEQAFRSGRVKIVAGRSIDEQTRKLCEKGICRSDDSHIIALAQIATSRLLYSNDIDLQRDFKDKNLINKPRGKVYSTIKNDHFTKVHRRLLSQRDICQFVRS